MADVDDEPTILRFQKNESELESNQILDDSSEITKGPIEIKNDSNPNEEERTVSFSIRDEKTDTTG